jgi:hypothetical protein
MILQVVMLTKWVTYTSVLCVCVFYYLCSIQTQMRITKLSVMKFQKKILQNFQNILNFCDCDKYFCLKKPSNRTKVQGIMKR